MFKYVKQVLDLKDQAELDASKMQTEENKLSTQFLESQIVYLGMMADIELPIMEVPNEPQV